MQSIFVSKDSLFSLICDDVFADDWEIYEESLKESQKEHEMTVGHAIEVLESVRKSCRYFPDIDGVINFAIEAIEKQNQQELFFDPKNLSQKELEEWQKNLKAHKLEVLEVKSEKKCECECKCNHTVEDADLQEKMKQTLKDKFFELDRIEKDSLAVSNMLDIYRLLFEVQP